MEGGSTRSQLQLDLAGTVVRPPTLIISRSFKTSPSLTPSSSPSFRRVSTPSSSSSGSTPKRESPTPSPTPRRDAPAPRGPAHARPSIIAHSLVSTLGPWLSGRRLLPWLVLVALWALAALRIQSRWSNDMDLPLGRNLRPLMERRSLELPVASSRPLDSPPDSGDGHARSASGNWKQPGATGPNGTASGSTETVTGTRESPGERDGEDSSKRSEWMSREEAEELRQGLDFPEGSGDGGWTAAVRGNGSIGSLVGPFDYLERKAWGWVVVGLLGRGNAKQRFGCEIETEFAKFVHGRGFVIVLHELSMTGAPLSMLELGTKMRSCGGRVSAVVLNKAGGLYDELVARNIRVLPDKSVHSWSAASKSDLVVVGSTACSSWVGQYLKSNPKGAARLAWWIMENRREYFDRSKALLGSVSVLLFLSDIQATTWKNWSAQEGLTMATRVEIVPLSVNEELASIAGLTPGGNDEKRRQLRDEVRKQMGLQPQDVLVVALSSINPGKGQLLFAQAALMVADGVEREGLPGLAHVETDSALEWRSRRTFLTGRQIFSLPEIAGNFSIMGDSTVGFSRVGLRSLLGHGKAKKKTRSLLGSKKGKKTSLKQRGTNFLNKTLFRMKPKSVETEDGSSAGPRLKILMGSVGSKSNKLPYVEKIARLLDRHPYLARITFSATATTHVAPFYAAADAYVMNAQGIGETFGRVTIEAMAFGLPILATNEGGSKEIVDANVTGLLHPTGRAGVPVLAQHIRWLLDHESKREEMGQKGRDKVKKLYRQDSMYERLAKIFAETVDGVAKK